MTTITAPTPAPAPRPPAAARRRLRLVPVTPPATRCPACRGALDDWALELARIDRGPLDCPACGAVLV